ncbi:hypothetical protein D3C87_1907330 [compost metagenome]
MLKLARLGPMIAPKAIHNAARISDGVLKRLHMNTLNLNIPQCGNTFGPVFRGKNGAQPGLPDAVWSNDH